MNQNKIIFHGALEKYENIELAGNNLQVIWSGVFTRYPELRSLLIKTQAEYAYDDINHELHVFPKGEGAFITAAGLLLTAQIVSAVVAVIGVGVAINQKRIQKQNKKKQGREAESALFDGIINSDTQGGVIPLCFGDVYSGSVVINNELDSY